MAEYLGGRINTAVGWMQKAVLKIEDRKEKPLLAWAGVESRKGVSLIIEFENWI
jgi:hypothetical protein